MFVPLFQLNGNENKLFIAIRVKLLKSDKKKSQF